MAKKRMFNLDIVENDVFLDMPLTSQALYFHLSMNADDDGFVSPKRIMRMIGAGQDDLQILIAKRYLLVFDSGCVVIKHWHKNNTIQKDRYVETTYKKEKDTLTRNEWGVYTEKSRMAEYVNGDLQADTKLLQSSHKKQGSDTKRKQNVSKMYTQIRLDKVSIENNYVDTNVSTAPEAPAPMKRSKDIDELFGLWERVVGYPITADIRRNRFAASNLLKKYKAEGMNQLIAAVAEAHKDRYAPRIADFTELQRDTNRLIAWARTKGNGSTKPRIGVVK